MKLLIKSVKPLILVVHRKAETLIEARKCIFVSYFLKVQYVELAICQICTKTNRVQHITRETTNCC